MILKLDLLTKTGKKGRERAVNILLQFSRTGGLPDPVYEYTNKSTTKRGWHHFMVRFRLPAFLQELDKEMNFFEFGSGRVVFGAGVDSKKQIAKSLAALEVVHRIEDALRVKRNGLEELLKKHMEAEKAKRQTMMATPVTQEIAGVSWKNVPIDRQFGNQDSRFGRIQFFSESSKEALKGARALTLLARDALPSVAHHSNHRDVAQAHNWANIQARGLFKGVNGPYDTENYGASKPECEQMALEKLGGTWKLRSWAQTGVLEKVRKLLDERPESFGMAKLFVQLPDPRFQHCKKLVRSILKNSPVRTSMTTKDARPHNKTSLHVHGTPSQEDQKEWNQCITSFRSHQSQWPLQVDDVESRIPSDSPVVLIRGGTGSGKTTRYPVLWSFSANHTETTHTVVAQPRRLACISAAQRVANEMGVSLGRNGCPIGYSIRFESRPSSKSAARTIDFETPGVILRKATRDPLLPHITHLMVDEVHERNADVDMLLALAKQAQIRRRNHPTLPPLQITLMSATLETEQWETYFNNEGRVQVLDVPDARRFPIDIVHVGDDRFPQSVRSRRWLAKGRRDTIDDLDERLCEACAEVVVSLLGGNDLGKGSILCFLPGMEEIQSVQRMLNRSPITNGFKICLLHSSLSSKEQNKVFESGPKIILSTNIAETSLTIPDVKIVVDSGRERQHSLLQANMNLRNTTVVGSQLATVDISQAAAKQRAGRAGRVSAGTCYRLYTENDFKHVLRPYTLPEMQRMDLSQLVLNSLSLYHPDSGHPLSLLLHAPDPPDSLRLQQTLYSMRQQGLLWMQQSTNSTVENAKVELTPLGRAVSVIPASPRLGRMLFMGLALRAIDPALTMAALLSVPKALENVRREVEVDAVDLACSDIVVGMKSYEEYLQKTGPERHSHGKRRIYAQVQKVRSQLENEIQKAVLEHVRSTESVPWDTWNTNKDRVAAQVSIICGATPHIAHLTEGRGRFSTRDVAGTAQIHPSSVNFDHGIRTHWYLYHELRQTRVPYLHVTTAASPLELALFGESSSDGTEYEGDDKKGRLTDWVEDSHSHEEWQYLVDQWVPVCMPMTGHRKLVLDLRRVLNYDMLQFVSSDPQKYVQDSEYEDLLLNVFASIEQERLPL